jgi:hypothetical protein
MHRFENDRNGRAKLFQGQYRAFCSPWIFLRKAGRVWVFIFDNGKMNKTGYLSPLSKPLRTRSELDCYFSDDFCFDDEGLLHNPLEMWKRIEPKYPTVARMAKDIQNAYRWLLKETLQRLAGCITLMTK